MKTTTGRVMIGATSDGHIELRIESTGDWHEGAVVWLDPTHVRWLMKELIKHMPEDAPTPSPSEGQK